MDIAGPVLIVDDEPDLLNLVDLHLRREGFQTLKAASATEALALLEDVAPSLIILDLMLPDLSGTEVCRRVRSNPRIEAVPIIILSARGEEIDRVVGFEVGADDYVVKSNLSVRELVLRVRAVLRRQPTQLPRAPSMPEESSAQQLDFGVLVIDQEAHRVWVSRREIPLTATEFKLLCFLALRQGRVQSRGMLLQDVWDMPPELNTRTVDTHIKRLREKLGEASGFVQTVRGVGYRFNPTSPG